MSATPDSPVTAFGDVATRLGIGSHRIARAVTAKGIVDLFVLVFMHPESCEVILSSSTANPNSAWVVRQTEEFIRQTETREHPVTHLIHDRDTKFSADFCRALQTAGISPSSHGGSVTLVAIQPRS